MNATAYSAAHAAMAAYFTTGLSQSTPPFFFKKSRSIVHLDRWLTRLLARDAWQRTAELVFRD